MELYRHLKDEMGSKNNKRTFIYSSSTNVKSTSTSELMIHHYTGQYLRLSQLHVLHRSHLVT